MTTDLIDRIYECSVVPQLWPEVLDELAGLANARGGLLFSARKALNWTASSSIQHVFAAYVEDGWFTRCPRRVCLMSRSDPSFFVEQDFWTDDELDQSPIYRDFFRQHGLGWSAGTGLQLPTGDSIVFSIEREFGGGPIERRYVERLNDLRPHLARSAFVTARLGLQRAKGGSETLTAMGLPTLVVEESGRVVEANALIEALSEHVCWGARNQIALADPRASELLRGALTALGQPGSRAGSFAMRDELGKAAFVAHVLPLRRTAHDVFANSYAMLVLTPLGGQRAPSVELLRSLFDLTAAEAKVAAGIAAGEALEDIAKRSAVAITTVRSQLRRVFDKTGCARQAELVALLSQAALPPDT